MKALLIVFIMLQIVLFQNCSGGFEYDKSKFSLTPLNSNGSSNGTNPTGGNPSDPGSSTGGNPVTDPNVLGMKFYDATKTLMSSGGALTAGADYTVNAIGYTATQTLTWALTTNQAGCTITQQITPFAATLRCSTTGTVSVQLTARDVSGVTKMVVSQHSMSPMVPDYCSNVANGKPAAVFRIPNGTAANAWNAPNSPIVVALGQTLRICNDDTTAHQLKTLGVPCASQPAPMAKGQFYDCTVSSTNTAGMSDAISAGGFSVTALDGRALYATSCQNCHGAFPGQGGLNASGASGSSIEALIQSNRGGMGSIRLTPDQLNAIGYALSY